MKTKEIEVYITPDDFKNLQNDQDKDWYAAINRVSDMGDLKARLIVYEPEKSVTITESQFDKAWQEALVDGFEYTNKYALGTLKQKLFGKES